MGSPVLHCTTEDFNKKAASNGGFLIYRCIIDASNLTTFDNRGLSDTRYTDGRLHLCFWNGLNVGRHNSVGGDEMLFRVWLGVIVLLLLVLAYNLCLFLYHLDRERRGY